MGLARKVAEDIVQHQGWSTSLKTVPRMHGPPAQARARVCTRALLPNAHVNGSAVLVLLRHLIVDLLTVSGRTGRAGENLESEDCGAKASSHTRELTSSALLCLSVLVCKRELPGLPCKLQIM